MNLFVGSMLILVLADNLLLMYLGWEGVGLCSYLLIGFWYKEPENGYAARKAFIVTRIGDTAMIIGLFLLFISFGTLEYTGSDAAGLREMGSRIATCCYNCSFCCLAEHSANQPSCRCRPGFLMQWQVLRL